MEKIMVNGADLVAHLSRKLEQAKLVMATGESREVAKMFQTQAFGAIEFACFSTYENDPDLEAKIIQLWNDDYRRRFELVIYGSGERA